MWKNIVQQSRPQMTARRMRIAYWIPKVTDAHSIFVILIAFPQLQWLHERASMLRCRYIACLVKIGKHILISILLLAPVISLFLIFNPLLHNNSLRTVTIQCCSLYTLSNKNPSAWNFLSPKPEVTCGTVAIIIRVVLLSPYLGIRGDSLSSIHYNQSHRVYINRRQQYICLIWD